VIYAIYEKMVEAGLDAAQARPLLREELETERGLMFPIRKAVAQVAPTDLIVSDMYLSGEIISSLLAEVCGLHTLGPIVRSNWGKHTGTIWPEILKHYVIRTHYGDNPTADGAVPQKFGIATVLLRDIDPTPWESLLLNSRYAHLARLQREARLRCLEEHDVFTQLLGPYLTLLAAFAARLVHEYGEGACFAFLSRDCDDLAAVFRAMYPAVTTCNVDVSRRLARNPAMDGVFQEILPENCVLVDGVSTGRSVRAMLERIGDSGRVFATLLFLDTLLQPEAVKAYQGRAFFKASDFPRNHYALELLLQSSYPPVTGLEYDAASGGIIRSFGAVELLPEEARRIAAKADMVTAFCRAVKTRGAPSLHADQADALLKGSLDAILGAHLPPELFPSFHVREKFAPF